jgi:hypothetical protein
MTKVNKLPFDVLSRVLFLLKDKHMMVEELLEFLVGIVDAQLLKTICLCM